ncbi:hypothetical protein SUGI_1026590 [Cryptomeria japonica]|nr:hypothetical protein SUGI_1026590 [Cryptomeria japonica]
MVCVSVLNDLARTLSGIPVVKRVEGSKTVPALALPKAETAMASTLLSVFSCPPAGNCRTAIDTPSPFNAGNSAATAFDTFTAFCPAKLLLLTFRNPVKVKKSPVNFSGFCPAGTVKSDPMRRLRQHY